MKVKVAVRSIDSYNLELIKSGIREFIESNDIRRLDSARTVLIKPNLLGGFAPEKAVTTHPVVLEALIQILLEAKKEVWIGDSPGGNVNLQDVWDTCGISNLAERYTVKLINLNHFGVQDIEHNGFKISLSKAVWEADTIINAGKYKTHGLVAYTGAVKNLYGLIPGLTKSYYHRQFPDSQSFGKLLTELYSAVKHRIAFNVLDGIWGMDGAGPSAGRVRKFGLLFCSESAPALDYVATKFMGFKLEQVPYLREAMHDDGILSSQIEYPLSFNDFQLPDVDIRTSQFSSRSIMYLPSALKYVFRKVYNFSPFITDECQSCYVCVKVCPVQTIKPDDNGVPVINTAKCIRCMCCHEMCPHYAITLHKSFLTRLIMPSQRRKK